MARLHTALWLLLAACGEVDRVDPDGHTDAPTVEDRPALKRLTVRELDRVLADLVDVSGAPAARHLPTDPRSPFDNALAYQQASPAWVLGMNALAREVADGLVADADRFAEVVGCPPDVPQDEVDACLDAFLAPFLRRAFRRDPAADDVDAYRGLADADLAAGGTFATAVHALVTAALQDPELLYRFEAVDAEGRLTGPAIASRMSFLLWGSMPDDALLDDADRLQDPEVRREHGERMLADPRAGSHIADLHAMWLGYDFVQDLPNTPYLVRTSADALVQRVVLDERLPWGELLTFPEAWLTQGMKAYFGWAPEGGDPYAASWYDTSPHGRAGILATSVFFRSTSHSIDSSPTLRGKAILERVLCRPVGDPPDAAQADAPPPPGTDHCKLDRYARHRTDPACAACHEVMDGIGIGLERYDPYGIYREFEYLGILSDDPDYECPLPEGADVPGIGAFGDVAELGELIAATGRAEDCFAEHLVGFVHGRRSGRELPDRVEEVQQVFAEVGHRLDQLLLEIVADDAFLEPEVP